MIKIGCLARFFNRYQDEVEFATRNKFDFMQLWYDNRGLCLHEADNDFLMTIKKYNFPTIIHAVLNINEFNEHVPKLIGILQSLQQNEIIIHPICENEVIDELTLDELDKKIKNTLDLFRPHGITLYLENNSKLDPIFTNTDEIKKIFTQNPELEFILDLAHVDNLTHLKELVQCKYPKCLHIADRHYDVVHEHLPIGHGEVDFDYIFNDVLTNFKGKIILEIVNQDIDIINSKKKIEKLVKR